MTQDLPKTIINSVRGLAQFGRAPGLGPGSRRFESCNPDKRKGKGSSWQMSDILYIVMPAYNEEANIESVVRQWYPHVEYKAPGSKLIIADAGSTDGTHEILKKLCREFDRLQILHTDNKQHGPKCIALYDYAIAQGADYIFQTDSDGQTSADEFPSFWHHRHDYDVILGNRTSRGDGRIRFFVEKVVTWLLYLFFKVRVPDANVPFRLMNRDCLRKYLGRLPKDYFLPNIMLTAFFKHYGCVVGYKCISFKGRNAGKNSINLLKIVKVGLKALKDFTQFAAEMKKEQ